MGESALISLRHLSGALPRDGDTICLLLDGIELNRLASVDPLGSLLCREGVLTLDVAGQSHALNWSTDRRGVLRNPEQFTDFVLFAGSVERGLQSAVTLLESDRVPFSDFERFSGRLLDACGGIGGVSAPYGGAMSAGAALAKSLIGAISSRIEDDLELSFLGDLVSADPCGGSLADGSARLVLERSLGGSGESPDLCIHFRSLPLPSLSAAHSMHLIIESVDFVLGGRSVPGRQIGIDGTFGGGARPGRLHLRYGVPRHPSRLSALVCVRDHCVYSGRWHGVLPFFIEVRLFTEEDLEAAEPVLRAGRDFYEELVRLEGSSRSEVREASDRFTSLSSGCQSLLSLALGFVLGEAPVGVVSGVLVRGEPSSHQATGGSVRTVCPGRSFEICVGSRSGDHIVFRCRLEED